MQAPTAFETQKERALEALRQRGLPPSHYEPPLFKLLWKCGVKVRPPHFQSFGSYALMTGLYFGLVWGCFMWLFFWSGHGMSIAMFAMTAGGAGALFGLMMAGVAAYQRRKYAVPAWETFASPSL